LSSFCHNIKVVPLRKKKTQKDTMFLLCVPNVIVCNQLLNLKPPPLDIRCFSRISISTAAKQIVFLNKQKKTLELAILFVDINIDKPAKSMRSSTFH